MKKKMIINKKETALRMKQLRIEKGLSQEKMAEILSISLSAYKKIESAENNISINTLMILREYFGVAADYILFGDEGSSDESWNAFIRCNDEEKEQTIMKIIGYYVRKNDNK